MNSIGLITGFLSVSFASSGNIIHIIHNTTDGSLHSIIVDNGDEINEYSYNLGTSPITVADHPLKWGLNA
jgi:hypothetical protein